MAGDDWRLVVVELCRLLVLLLVFLVGCVSFVGLFL